MLRTLLLSVFALITGIHCQLLYGPGRVGSSQVQMPEVAQLNQPDDLQAQIKALQQNVSDIWTYIYQLRSAVSNHLTHLRQHQAELESSMHMMEHHHASLMRSSGHHSGEHHSHSGEQHSHSGEHSHGDDHSHGGDHSHSGGHSHGDDHSHGGDHSHSGEHHSHSGEHHSHSGEHGHQSYSHSHSSHDHSREDHHHHHDHKDSHESEDVQTQQVVGPAAESVSPVTSEPVVRQEHNHHHSHGAHDSMNLLNEPFHHHHHHHDHRHDSGSRNRTVELPKYSDYGQYDLALCRVEPNKALPENQQQDIVGTITLWQKKTGGPLNLHVRLQGFDVGHGHDHHMQQVVQQPQDNVTTVPVGHRHGFHIHASGDLSNGCQSTGPHYNPKGVNHGAPNSLVRHVGDLGNIECDEHGNTNIMFSDDVASLRGQYSVVGKAIVIHAKADDLGLGGDAESLRTGNAGARLACCVIQSVEKIPIRQYKAMKSATQYQNR